METEYFIIKQISKLEELNAKLMTHYNNNKINLNERGNEKYSDAIGALRDAVNHLRIASVNAIK